MKLFFLLIPVILTACGTTQAQFDQQSKAYCESLSKAEYCAQIQTCYPVLQLNCTEGEN